MLHLIVSVTSYFSCTWNIVYIVAFGRMYDQLFIFSCTWNAVYILAFGSIYEHFEVF